jgi:hypothetical protein
MATQVKAKHGVAGTLQGGTYMGVTPAVFSKTVHQADYRFRLILWTPSLNIQFNSVNSFPDGFEIVHSGYFKDSGSFLSSPVLLEWKFKDGKFLSGPFEASFIVQRQRGGVLFLGVYGYSLSSALSKLSDHILEQGVSETASLISWIDCQSG